MNIYLKYHIFCNNYKLFALPTHKVKEKYVTVTNKD